MAEHSYDLVVVGAGSGNMLPDSVLAELRNYPAILLGAIGHPDVKPGILEKGILLRARFEMELYINQIGRAHV